MKNMLKLEEVAMLVLGCVAYSSLGLQWWIFFALFLSPDLGMAGYLANHKTGAFTYNLFHHKGIAAALWIVGLLTATIPLQVAGIIVFAHASFDRVLGYGLKHSDSFHHTHLGTIGKKNIQV
jgi:hypothetical protein